MYANGMRAECIPINYIGYKFWSTFLNKTDFPIFGASYRQSKVVVLGNGFIFLSIPINLVGVTTNKLEKALNMTSMNVDFTLIGKLEYRNFL